MMTENITQVSHMRPFRRRKKQQQLRSMIVKEQQEYYQYQLCHMNQYHHHNQQQHYDHLTSSLSSAISHDHHHLPIDTTTSSTTPTSTACGGRCFTPRTKSITHKIHRYSSTNTSAQMVYLSIVVYVIISLLNLTTINLQPRLILAQAAASSQSSAASQATSQSNSLTLSQQQQQQQQQSNTVIQYPNAATTTTTTAIKARYKTMYACEDTLLTMDCEAGSKINLIRANFGRFSITQCNEQGQLDLSIDCMSPITFRIMQERCQDKPRCSVNATSVLFGDRCPKTRKYLEVHFQCQSIEPDMVDIRKSTISPSQVQPQSPVYGPNLSPMKPPNNPTSTPRSNQILTQPLNVANNNYSPTMEDTLNSPSSPIDINNQQQQLPTPVMNSPIMSSVDAINSNIFDHATNKLSDMDNREPIIISLRHLQMENMSRPRCFQWDSVSRQWTERGTRILETNQTHTICAFDQTSSYVLVMDYSGPLPTISNKPSIAITQPSTNPIFNSPLPDLLETQPIPIDNNSQPTPFATSNQFDVNRIIHPPAPGHQQQPQQPQSPSTRLFSLFGYLLAIIFVALGLMTLAFVASSMRSSAGAALKSLGNFTPFNGPKHKQRRQNGGPSGMHPNKDVLVINNSNGHQFIYTPASATKISSSSSTHILSAGQPTGLAGQHQGTLHRIQQQMYSGNGDTLSSLSATGAQSNNYYYGLMGLNPLFHQQQQQQQQQHHFSQHHLSQQAQIANHQQQQAAANYNHQANKSTMSAESANSSSSSSGVESGSTSMQQQQAQSQQACLVTAMNNNDYNLMTHPQSSNYGHHQQQSLFPNSGASFAQQQPAMTLNAHYSFSGGMQSINDMAPNQAIVASAHSRQASSQMRDHIYECVDDDKMYMARLLMPTNNSEQQQHQNQQQFGTLGHNQQQIMSNNNSRAMTLSSRLLQDVFQQQQQKQQQQQQQNQNCNTTVNSDNNRRNYPQPAIVRDNQAKTNIICSKLAQVTPQRATEVGTHSGRCDQSTRLVGEHKFARQMGENE